MACPYCLASVTVPTRPATGSALWYKVLLPLTGILSIGGLVAALSIPWVSEAELVVSQVSEVQLATYESHPLPQPRLESSNEPVSLATTPIMDGLGVSREQIIASINRCVPAEFKDATQLGDSKRHFVATVDNADVILWGNSDDLETVTVIGRFDNAQTNKLLTSLIAELMPSWHIEHAGNWFGKALERCDNDTLVSTLRDNVELTMASSTEPGAFFVFFQRDRLD